jgi:hypothetical protein
MTGCKAGLLWLSPVASSLIAYGRLPIPSPSQQCKRRHAAEAPAHEGLFVLSVQQTLHTGLMRARDLIIDSVPILAWRKADPDAAVGHALSRSSVIFVKSIACDATSWSDCSAEQNYSVGG